MKKRVPHNVLSISEMTKRPNKIHTQTIDLEKMILTENLIKELRASRSMFNKTVYLRIFYAGCYFNVEDVKKQKNGMYQISLISPQAFLIAEGGEEEYVQVKRYITL